MALVNRKVTYRLYPTPRQDAVMRDMLGAHQRLYNAALEQRIVAYRSVMRRSVSYVDQARDLTELRAADPTYAALNAQSSQATLKRLDRAFAAFFRRLKERRAGKLKGAKPKVAKAGVKAAPPRKLKRPKVGFPRFKAYDRFAGWGYPTHGDGWRFLPGQDKHGVLRLTGVGHLKVRGVPRTPGEAKTLEICRKGGRWYASITTVCTPMRTHGTGAVGLDLGLETFATLALDTARPPATPPAGAVVRQGGALLEIKNPRHTRRALQALKKAQQAVARKVKGSKNRAKAKVTVARLHQKVANQRLDFLHQVTAWLVMMFALIATEQLSVKNMTAYGGNRKRGLNRELLSISPATFLDLLKTKAEEAALQYVEVPTIKVKPSQTCSACGRQAKKTLAERVHACPCGLTCGRDDNAARVMLNWAFRARGREPTAYGVGSSGAPSGRVKLPALKYETPAIPALLVGGM